MIEHFAADEMDHNAGRVIGAGGLALVRSDSVRVSSFGVQHDGLEHLAEHLRVDGHFLIERRVLGHGEVECFQEFAENALECGVANLQGRIRLASLGGLEELIVIEEAAIQKGDAGQSPW